MKAFVVLCCIWIHYAQSQFTVSQLGHFSLDAGRDIDVDRNGFLYISGFTDQDLYGDTNAGAYDLYIAKYDIIGNVLDGALYGSNGFDVAQAQAFSKDESTLYVGGFTTAAWFSSMQGGSCGFLISVQAQNLSVLNWGSQLCGSVLRTEFTELAIDPNNDDIVYASGWSYGDFPAYGQTNSGAADGLIVQWNVTAQNITWVRLVGLISDDRFWNIAVDNTGIVWASGWIYTTSYDCGLVKFHSNGTNLVTRSLGSASQDVCHAVVPDNEGGAFLSGGSWGLVNTTWQFENETTWLSPFVLHLNSTYDVTWLTQLNTTGDVSFIKLKQDLYGTLYVTGWSTDADFDGHPEIGDVDLVFASFLPTGERISSALMGTSETDQAFDLYVDSENVYMVGATNGSWVSPIQPPTDTILVKTSGIPPRESSKSDDHTALIAGVASAGGVLIVAGAASVFFVMKRRKLSSNDHANVEMSSRPSHRDGWEIDYRKLDRGRELGRGAFGVVYLATWRNSSVAVKQLDTTNTSAQTTANFLKEAQNVRNLRPHPNICTIIGVCTNPEYPICIVMEYIPFGSLSDMLVEKQITLDPYMVLQFAKDIASGMGHLHAESILHCDLACRNLLVSARGNEFQLKISDFGLSRMVEASEYVSSTHNFPIRWSAPETLRMGKLSRASDIWSFGITLWEMIEERLPYPNMTNDQIPNEIEQGFRLPRPTKQTLPESFYEMMLKCWSEIPSSRPTFEDISKELAVIETKVPKRTEGYAEMISRISNKQAKTNNEDLYNTIPFIPTETYHTTPNNNNHNSTYNA